MAGGAADCLAPLGGNPNGASARGGVALLLTAAAGGPAGDGGFAGVSGFAGVGGFAGGGGMSVLSDGGRCGGGGSLAAAGALGAAAGATAAKAADSAAAKEAAKDAAADDLAALGAAANVHCFGVADLSHDAWPASARAIGSRSTSRVYGLAGWETGLEKSLRLWMRRSTKMPPMIRAATSPIIPQIIRKICGSKASSAVSTAREAASAPSFITFDVVARCCDAAAPACCMALEVASRAPEATSPAACAMLGGGGACTHDMCCTAAMAAWSACVPAAIGRVARTADVTRNFGAKFCDGLVTDVYRSAAYRMRRQHGAGASTGRVSPLRHSTAVRRRVTFLSGLFCAQ